AQNATESLEFEIKPEQCQRVFDVSKQAMADANFDEINIAMAMAGDGSSVIARDADDVVRASFDDYYDLLDGCRSMEIDFSGMVSNVEYEDIDVSDLDAEKAIGALSVAKVMDQEQVVVTIQALKNNVMVAATCGARDQVDDCKQAVVTMLSRI
ncbi:MAG: hypothetical protein Q4Q03_02295, partial [Bowdeniella nasicola]|nr:hypothetical protein [Bowdeniella nasicola]